MTNANKLYILFCRWVWGGCASILRIKRGDGRDNYCVGVQQREGPVVSPRSREKGTAERSSSGRDTYKRSSNSPSSIRNSCAAETAPPSGDPRATGSFSLVCCEHYTGRRDTMGKKKGLNTRARPQRRTKSFRLVPRHATRDKNLGLVGPLHHRQLGRQRKTKRYKWRTITNCAGRPPPPPLFNTKRQCGPHKRLLHSPEIQLERRVRVGTRRRLPPLHHPDIMPV